ncbi:STE like transcription factor-domain-containing protein [Gongronella butleri]|nr:STE like transcription factor-domain-containing protein [Gongronella butleri]
MTCLLILALFVFFFFFFLSFFSPLSTLLFSTMDAPNQQNTQKSATSDDEELMTAANKADESSLIANILLPLQVPTDNDYAQRMAQIDELKLFLATANNRWHGLHDLHCPQHQIHSFPLPTGDQISCVLWNNLYYITGTDIVRSLVFRFHAFGRPVQNLKKFEEGVFSDLRNLKPGQDASLEEPRSEFLDMLYKNNCIRTKKKQKVFYWFSVPHDRLFLDALERDLKREKLGIEATSKAVSTPAITLTLDASQDIFELVRKSLSLFPCTTL